MLKLQEIKKDAQISGIQADEIIRIIQVEPVGDAALTVYYKDSQGKLNEQMLFRSDESRLSLATARIRIHALQTAPALCPGR